MSTAGAPTCALRLFWGSLLVRIGSLGNFVCRSGGRLRSPINMDSTVNDNDQYHEMFRDDGDIVLRGSDHIRFRTHIFILRQSSAFFRSMFSLPQPSIASSQQTITLDEDSSVIAPVLLMVSNTIFPSDMVGSLTQTSAVSSPQGICSYSSTI